jgi:hypothetical protein
MDGDALDPWSSNASRMLAYSLVSQNSNPTHRLISALGEILCRSLPLSSDSCFLIVDIYGIGWDAVDDNPYLEKMSSARALRPVIHSYSL